MSASQRHLPSTVLCLSLYWLFKSSSNHYQYCAIVDTAAVALTVVLIRVLEGQLRNSYIP
jgi:hypothetical protein